MKRIFIILLAMIAYVCTSAQLCTNELPISFDPQMKSILSSKQTIKTVTMPALDMAKIVKEDEEDEEYGMPPRFGYSHKVNYNLDNSGKWLTLPNGDKLWRLNVVCPNALSINFLYDKFWIPEGGKFFIYSKDKKHSIGAFTSINNKGDSINVRGFATGLVYGNDVMLEYYQPKEVTSNAIISIEYIVHGYRYINIEDKGFGESGSCQVNVNCSEGQEWQYEKKAVALILVNGNRYCTGSLINTADLSQVPYFLTANHCVCDYGDAVNNPNLDFYSFYWKYEAPGCTNVNVEPTPVSTSGATIVANDSISDFALLRLTENPQLLTNYIPFYLGWDRSGYSGNPGVCIHHPSGDVKKISTVNLQPQSTEYGDIVMTNAGTHWMVTWKATSNGHGTTEGGSSGSPLLTAAHKVIGQLHGGLSNCMAINAPDWYGKFDVSWTGNGNTSMYRRLNCWLDSQNIGLQSVEGLWVISHDCTLTTNRQLYGNICINSGGRLVIQSNVEMMENGRVIVKTGGTLLINGGTLSNVNLEMETGSFLYIISGGVIETQNGFMAPAGVTVSMNYGLIL